MELEEIKADELVEMTASFERAFKSHDCDPMCHCCGTMITVGNKFHLATINETKESYYGGRLELQRKALKGKKVTPKSLHKELDWMKIREEFKEFDLKNRKEAADGFTLVSKEVMLCDKCTSETYLEMKLKQIGLAIKERDKPIPGGCFRINGKIIH